ncbi:MAG: alkaline phosphatase family protein [Chloroflexota bacterium]|nr:alkaline phosphatase family protein [Chloroflexota bacterium]
MHVTFVMIDGLRPDAIAQAEAPTLKHIMAHGAYTLRAQSVMPSVTLPCHMSIFHSVPPERHGITTNIYTPMARPLPGLIEVAKDADKRCAFFTNWEELRDLSRPGGLYYSYMINESYNLEHGDRLVADAAAPHLAEFDFTFVYLGTVDSAGHFFTWMSDEYLQQVARADAELAKLVAALPEDGVLIVQADHGGHERTHGTDAPEDMTIPWMIMGAGVKQGYEIQRPVSLLDTAPTIARLLGLQTPREWEGTSVDEAFIP